MKAKIKWLFFDVGNVLFNDDPVMIFVYENLFKKIHKIDSSFTFTDLLTEREQLIIGNSDGRHYRTLGKRHLGEKRWHDLWLQIIEELEHNYEKYSPSIPGIEYTLGELSGTYKLGIAANQVSACRTALENRGLIKYFSIVLLSAEIGLLKPDDRFFKTLIQKSKCQPDEMVMIGDRIDNDILPANKIGMKTIWVKLDLEKKGYIPDSEHSCLYLDSLKRVAISCIEPQREVDKPDQTVTSLTDISGAVEGLG